MRGEFGRLLAGLVVVAGLALLASSGVVIWRAQGVSDVGVDDAARLSTVPAVRPSPAAIPVTDGRALPSTPAASQVAPVGLTIPAIAMTAPVDPVGITPETGELAVPDRVDRVGWYRFGPGLAASTGSIVIAGHVDGAGQGRGAFYRLPELVVGDRIEVADGDGVTHEFEVVAREVHDKTEIPLARYFARDGEPRLTLITCGGAFDQGSGRYQDNIVVTAVPVR